jgi:hypothetical protein
MSNCGPNCVPLAPILKSNSVAQGFKTFPSATFAPTKYHQDKLRALGCWAVFGFATQIRL